MNEIYICIKTCEEYPFFIEGEKYHLIGIDMTSNVTFPYRFERKDYMRTTDSVIIVSKHEMSQHLCHMAQLRENKINQIFEDYEIETR